MKSTFHVVSVLFLVVLASAASLTIEAQDQRAKQSPGPTNPTPPQDIKAPSKSPKGKTIGDCDSVKSCTALKAACESKQVGGAFKPSNKNGSGGICVKEGTKPTGNLTAPSKNSRDANCYTHALCQALKTRCHGTWKQDFPNTGQGKCID